MNKKLILTICIICTFPNNCFDKKLDGPSVKPIPCTNHSLISDVGIGPLHVPAATSNLSSTIDDLHEEYGVNTLTIKGKIPLSLASQFDHRAIAEYLLTNTKVELKITDFAVYNPPHEVGVNNHFSLVNYLIEKQSTPASSQEPSNLELNFSQDTGVHVTLYKASIANQANEIISLIKERVDVLFKQDSNGFITLLMRLYTSISLGIKQSSRDSLSMG